MSLSTFTPNPTGPGGTISILLNGKVVAVWTAVDSAGNFVPNSYYHFVILETTADGNTVQLERDAFISTFHGESVTLVVMPNLVHPGDFVKFNASFAGVPADSQSKIKIYTIGGELVQTLGLPAGTASWDLKNLGGQMVSTGIYIAVLDGRDPASGIKLRKVAKILVTH
jgi:hypothetical protein